jgi:hypothetical protein
MSGLATNASERNKTNDLSVRSFRTGIPSVRTHGEKELPGCLVRTQSQAVRTSNTFESFWKSCLDTASSCPHRLGYFSLLSSYIKNTLKYQKLYSLNGANKIKLTRSFHRFSIRFNPKS